MDAAAFITLAIVVLTALAFDFTNGFYDTGNAMATSIATKALKPFNAMALSVALNVVEAFLPVRVATAAVSGIVDLGPYNLDNPQEGLNLLIVVFTALIGVILWNLLVWLLELSSNSSHVLFGDMIDAVFTAMGSRGVEWSSIVGKIVILTLTSPIIAALVSATATFLIYWVTNTIPSRCKVKHFHRGQTIAASLISPAHGTGDAQKIMGVIFLALIATGNVTETQRVPVWVIVVYALAIALGALSGGWRVIRTLGKGLVEVEAPQGTAAEAISAAIILASTAGSMALSATHVATGVITGTGLGRKDSKVRWGVAKRMVPAQVITLPCVGLVGYAAWWIAALFSQVHPLIGVLADLALLLAMVGIILARSHQDKVDANNANEDWNQDSKVSKSAQQATPLEMKKALEQDIEGVLGTSMDVTVASVQIPNVSRCEHIQRLREERLELAARLRDIERELEKILFADESLAAPQHDSIVQDLVTATPHQVAVPLPPADVVRPDHEDKQHQGKDLLMTAVQIVEAVLWVAALALVFGVGMPTLLALRMRAHAGRAICGESGTVADDTKPGSAMKLVGQLVYAILAVVILLGTAWLAKDSIGFYTGWYPFGSLGAVH